MSTPKSPEDVRPYPKAAPRNEKTRRGKAKKSTVLTDTPERQRSALAADGKKKKKSGPVKRILTFPNAEAEPEPEEVMEDEKRTKYARNDKKHHYIGPNMHETTRSIITSDSSLSQKS